MKINLTRSQMLARWRLHRGYDIPHYDSETSRTDGIDLDEILSAEMDEWYSNLLRTAPLSRLVPVEKAGVVSVPGPGSAEMRLRLADTTVRIAGVRLSSWRYAATIVDDPASPQALRQLHPYTRATVSAPVAVFDPVGKTLDLYPYDSDVDILETLTVIEHSTDSFSFDSSALALI